MDVVRETVGWDGTDLRLAYVSYMTCKVINTIDVSHSLSNSFNRDGKCVKGGARQTFLQQHRVGWSIAIHHLFKRPLYFAYS